MTKNMITINILELASELADRKLIADYENKINIYIDEDNGDVRYTEQAQDIFNGFFFDYQMLIKSCK